MGTRSLLIHNAPDWQRQILIANLVLSDHQVIFSSILVVAGIKLIDVFPIILTI